MFDLVLLRSFSAVAETLSFTAAAAELRMSQSTVSKHVRALELAAGTTLLVRDTREVLLTHDGDSMVTFARRILESHDDATAYFAGRPSDSRLRLGVDAMTAIGALPAILREFRFAWPDVAVDLRVGEGQELASGLRAGDLDVALVPLPAAPSARAVIRQRYVWVGAPDLELRPGDPLPIILLDGLYPSRMSMFRLLEEAGLSWRVTCIARDWHGVYAGLRAGLGLVILPDRLIPNDLARMSADWLPDLQEIESAVIDNPNAPRPWVREFRRVARRILEHPDEPTARS